MTSSGDTDIKRNKYNLRKSKIMSGTNINNRSIF